MSKIKLGTALLIIFVVGMLINLPASVFAKEDGEIRIAVAGPHTGFAAAFGEDMYNGVELALSQLGGKLAGIPVKLFKIDTKCDAGLVGQKFRDAVYRDKVNYFIGPMCGSAGLAATEWAGDFPNIPVLIGYSAPEDITMRKRKHNVLRPGWTGTQTNYHLGRYVVEEKGWKKIILIGQDYSFPWGQAQGFIRGFCSAGGEKIYKIWHPPNTEDYSSYLLKVRSMAKDYDALAFDTAGSDMIAVFKQYFDFGLDKVIPAFGFTNAFDNTALPALGDKAIGMFSAMHYSEGIEYAEKGMFTQEQIDRWLKFKNAYRKMYNKVPSCGAEQGYVAVMVYKKALAAIGGDYKNTKALIDALHKVEMRDAPRGPFVFDEFGHATQNIYIREVQKRDGDLVNVPIKVYRDITQFVGYDNMKEKYMKQPVASNSYPPGECNKLCDNGLGPYPDGSCPD